MLRKLIKIIQKSALPEIQLRNRERENFEFLKTHTSPITFICSYPRSGNTWLRHLMADCLLQKAGCECAAGLPIHPDKLIPDIHCHQLDEISCHTTKNIFCKSHFSPLQISNFLGESVDQRINFIYLYRNPDDALISFFYFKLRYPETSNVAEIGSDKFCKDELSNWIEHIDQTLQHMKNRKNVCLIKYEDLHQYTSGIIHEIWKWLQIDIPNEACFHAVNHMQFTKLQNMEKQSNSNTSGHLFFRKGQIGDAANELKHTTIEQIYHRTADVLRRANSRCLKAEFFIASRTEMGKH
jgi:hypothetical protein